MTSRGWLHPLRRLLALGALGTLAAGALLLTTGANSARGSTPVQEQGVLRAEAAGITIGPGAAQIMESAPLGSCMNDPTQAKCGALPTRIVADGTTGPDGTSYASPTTGTDGTTSPNYVNYACAVTVNWLKKTTFGYAKTKGSNQCTTAASSQQLDVELYQYWTSDSSWHWANSCYTSGPGGTTISCTTNRKCAHNWSRYWQGIAYGYSVVDGVDYMATHTLTDILNCSM